MNKKTLAIVAAAVVFVLLLIGGMIWFWSLGALAAEGFPEVRIEVPKSPVEVRHVGSSDWQKLETASEVREGDTVRVGKGGEAWVRWGDRGVTRIESESEVTIERLPADKASVTNASIRLHVAKGRTWSRLLKLLDLQSSAEVGTDSVVATVRGTSFGIAVAKESEAAVTESVVSIRGRQGGTETLLREGQWGSFNASGTPSLVRELTQNDAWAQDNKQKDEAFDQLMQREIDARLRSRLGGTASVPDWLLRWSEQTHLLFVGGEKQEDLASKYLGRRIARALTQDPTVSLDVASLHLGGGAREQALRDVRQGLFLVTPRPGASLAPSIELTSGLQSLRAQFLGDTGSDPLYAQALTIDDTIDAWLFGASGLDEPTKLALLASISDLEKRIVSEQGLTDTERTGLFEKASALRKRIGDVFAQPNLTDTVTPPEEATSTTPVPKAPTKGAGTKTPTTPPAPTPAPTPTPPKPSAQPAPVVSYQYFTMTAQPASVYVGDAVTLRMYGVKADGSRDDVTSRTTFSVRMTSEGTVGGNVFRPANSGVVQVTGVVTQDGQPRSSSASVSVTKRPASARVFSGLSLQLLGATTVTCYGRVPFKVMAAYEDGTTADVTTLSTMSVSDPKLAYLTAGYVNAECPSQTTTVTIFASYAEGGVSKNGSGVITIQPDPLPITVQGAPCTGRLCK